MEDKFAPPTFGKPATYSGRKRINVDARLPDYNFDVSVLYLEKEKNGWVIVLPAKSTIKTRLPRRILSAPKPLKEAKALATGIVVAAGDIDRLESLRGVTELPAWLLHLKKESK